MSIPTNAQADASYKGQRLSAFGFMAEPISGGVLLSYSVANTGTALIDSKTSKVPLFIELDTFAVPNILKGHLAMMGELISKETYRLKPGEVKSGYTLKFFPEKRASNPSGYGDLVIDTAFVTYYDDLLMKVRYSVSNNGKNDIYVLEKSETQEMGLVINSYLVSGHKITRGAIPAGTVTMKQGTESFDGWLRPGQRLLGEVDVNLLNKTKFSPNIALELDPFLITNDIDRTNNTYTIEVQY